ncbi:hypothetical protein BX600DRAFT_439632 [Xylariales sp. PMI_506]|nr:hypothetical protein BX600DRAFT_439632 [Xylariales sp. PMI_506]
MKELMHLQNCFFTLFTRECGTLFKINPETRKVYKLKPDRDPSGSDGRHMDGAEKVLGMIRDVRKELITIVGLDEADSSSLWRPPGQKLLPIHQTQTEYSVQYSEPNLQPNMPANMLYCGALPRRRKTHGVIVLHEPTLDHQLFIAWRSSEKEPESPRCAVWDLATLLRYVTRYTLDPVTEFKGQKLINYLFNYMTNSPSGDNVVDEHTRFGSKFTKSFRAGSNLVQVTTTVSATSLLGRPIHELDIRIN